MCSDEPWTHYSYDLHHHHHHHQKAMTPEQIDKVIEQLNSTGGALYDAAVRQAFINSTTDVIWTLCAIVGLWISKNIIRSNFQGVKDAKLGAGLNTLLAAFITFISVITICCFFGAVEDIVTGFVNPRYWAITHLAKLIHKF
jgi:CBS domain containing-hemolysin-like protein